MRQINCEIIAVGTELLLGQIANTNAKWLSEQLAVYGINTFYHTVVGDNLFRVEEVFRQAQQRSDVIIVSGGLGPTDDDLTREAFQQLTNFELVEDKESMDKIEDFFVKQNLEMTPNNRRQARVFANAEVLQNRVGMAPGMRVIFDDKIWFFLPGVPREMKQLALDGVFPYLVSQLDAQVTIQSMVLKFIGIGESELEHKLQDLIRGQNNPTIAPLAQKEGVVIRLTAKEQTADQARALLEDTKEKILEKVGQYFYGLDNQTLEERLYLKLKSQNKRLAAAESLTGGMFTEKLVSIIGASDVCLGGIVCYDTSVKRNVLKIPAEIIDNQGVVSEECALAMAKNVSEILNSDIGISFTGVAGPTTIDGHPVGTVYISIYQKDGKQLTEKFVFQGDRFAVRRRSMLKGYELLLNFLNS
ncbi:competence/damage-inducible protein A [Ornithinibacillus sp. 4-3]|uniref:Putative competence-damage inducible protein n=1 Tax=Ornithinibacillus sp. 4-3 TaxID=3231488 RepID=A0AB39HUB0_9BACI